MVYYSVPLSDNCVATVDDCPIEFKLFLPFKRSLSITTAVVVGGGIVVGGLDALKEKQ